MFCIKHNGHPNFNYNISLGLEGDEKKPETEAIPLETEKAEEKKEVPENEIAKECSTDLPSQVNII